MRPLGSAGGTLTGAAGALLTIGLLAAAGNFTAGLGALGALTAVGEVSHDHLMENGLVDGLTKYILGKLDIANDLTGNIVQCYVRHFFFPPYFTVLFTVTMVPLAPGMAPLMSSRFRAASTRATSRFWTVTVSLPMWPGRRLVRKTSPG